jgi:hypothetical protein
MVYRFFSFLLMCNGGIFQQIIFHPFFPCGWTNSFDIQLSV